MTTGRNRVSHALERINSQTTIIDCSLFKSRAEFLQTLSAIKPFDIMVTFRCPYLVPTEIFSRARIAAVNIHPSLLPRYAGANPWLYMMAAHETEGGVTLHHLTDKIDDGEIILQKSFYMDLSDGFEDARRKSEQIAVDLLLMYLRELYYHNLHS